VLLEFDPKLIWVSGPDRDRTAGVAAFRISHGSLTQTLAYGSVNDTTLTSTISIFFRDTDGGVLATQDCVVHFKKSPELPEPMKKFLNTVDWIHVRLNVATYLVFGGALVVGALWGYFSFRGMDQEKRERLLIRTHLAPGRYTGTWTEEFSLDPTSAYPTERQWLNRGDWNPPAQRWSVRHSPGAKNNPAKGLALLNTASWGMPQPFVFNDQQLYDFTIEIRCNLPPPKFTYSWALRAQSDGTRGYVFTVHQFNKGLRMEGVVNWRFGSARLIPVHGFDIPVDCCRKGDYLILRMQALSYNFTVTSFSLNNDDDYEGRDLVGRDILDKTGTSDNNRDPYVFQDGYGSYRYGSLGLFADDPEHGPEIEYVNVFGAK
jgi:hypothetical protein